MIRNQNSPTENITSPFSGHTYSFGNQNSGQIFPVTNASNINIASFTHSSTNAGGVKKNVMIAGIAPGSNAWLRIHSGFYNETYQDGAEIYKQATATEDHLVFFYPSSTTCVGFQISYLATRKPGTNTWFLRGNYQKDGLLEFLSFNVICTAKDSGTIPRFYFSGVETVNCYFLAELLEEPS